jgi:hypothetical protein
MLGSARVPRVGFGVAPKQAFPTHRGGPCFHNPEKFAIARTRSPARHGTSPSDWRTRETRALPRS